MNKRDLYWGNYDSHIHHFGEVISWKPAYEIKFLVRLKILKQMMLWPR